jgi:squalene-hopene/tetraprenyl-beta-curcumene cyclase
MSQEIRVKGDWAVRRPQLEPSGFAFEFENDNYPDVDDTAEVVMALRGVAHPERPRSEAVIQRALRWTVGMQCRDGGFAAFDADNTRALCGELPFCDFGEVIDPPSADVTAHVIEMLAGEGLGSDLRTRAAIDWLLRAQEPDGSWFGRWGANHVYGTGAALPALVRAGIAKDHPAIRRAARWLEGCQNPDGGWGEDLRSYVDRAWRGRGESTASQTAWALLALLAADGHSPAVKRGVEWLAGTQRADGGWDEPWFTGTGFPGDFYIRYHLYALSFPLMALGRYVRSSR